MFRYIIISLFILIFSSCESLGDEEKRILIFSKTESGGYRHTSIPNGKEAIIRICYEKGITADTSENASDFNEQNLQRYDAVVFLNTVGAIFNQEQKNSFQQYIQSGGGFVGIHGASGTEYDWPWYGKLVGGYFLSHPEIQSATIDVLNKEHPSTQHLPERWERTDEWYNFKDLNPDINILATLDESSYTGGENPDIHPVAWYHEYDGGRAFYTALGHLTKHYDEPEFLQHILGGIQWAMGNDQLYENRNAIQASGEEILQK